MLAVQSKTSNLKKDFGLYLSLLLCVPFLANSPKVVKTPNGKFATAKIRQICKTIKWEETFWPEWSTHFHFPPRRPLNPLFI